MNCKGARFEDCTINGKQFDPEVFAALGATGVDIFAGRGAETGRSQEQSSPIMQAAKGLAGVVSDGKNLGSEIFNEPPGHSPNEKALAQETGPPTRH